MAPVSETAAAPAICSRLHALMAKVGMPCFPLVSNYTIRLLQKQRRVKGETVALRSTLRATDTGNDDDSLELSVLTPRAR